MVSAKDLAVVVMGVSGCGKSSLASALAETLCVRFIEGDELHPEANIEKMSKGLPLCDADRWPWLDRIAAEIASSRSAGVVTSCSALRASYRDRLREHAGGPLVFLHLHGSVSILTERVAKRSRHFMPASLLRSQLEALETPLGEQRSHTIDVTKAPADQLDTALKLLGI